MEESLEMPAADPLRESIAPTLEALQQYRMQVTTAAEALQAQTQAASVAGAHLLRAQAEAAAATELLQNIAPTVRILQQAKDESAVRILRRITPSLQVLQQPTVIGSATQAVGAALAAYIGRNAIPIMRILERQSKVDAAAADLFSNLASYIAPIALGIQVAHRARHVPVSEIFEAFKTMDTGSAVERKSEPHTPFTRSRMIAFAAYFIAALSLHLSNVMTTRDRVFDSHQFLTDEFLAIGLALAVLAVLPKD